NAKTDSSSLDRRLLVSLKISSSSHASVISPARLALLFRIRRLGLLLVSLAFTFGCRVPACWSRTTQPRSRANSHVFKTVRILLSVVASFTSLLMARLGEKRVFLIRISCNSVLVLPDMNGRGLQKLHTWNPHLYTQLRTIAGAVLLASCKLAYALGAQLRALSDYSISYKRAQTSLLRSSDTAFK